MAIATINPTTGALVKSYNPHSADDVEARLAAAASAARTWRETPIAHRARVVRRAGELLERDAVRYARLMTLEMGKTLRSAEEEARKCATGCAWYADNADALLADEHITIENEQAYVAFQPLGVVLAVMPWNFPFWQVIRFAAPALTAGNVGLLKHASNVPQCALALEQLFMNAGAPAGVFQTLLIEASAVNAVVADDRIAAVTLTGSERAGASVARMAGAHLKKTVLELGGSDPFIVLADADVGAAAEMAVKARVINNGQSCIAAKRFIVVDAVFDEFAQRFVAGMEALRVGDPMDPMTDVGPLATLQIREDLRAQVADTIERGARVLLRGGPHGREEGWFYDPTVLTDIPVDSPAYRDELFGPAASLFRAADTADAIRIANDSRFGLGASVWTRDAGEGQRMAKALDVGTVVVNGMVRSDVRLPFGGVKMSGHGRELGAYGLREFANVKTVRLQSGV
jgi:succinate-semialdehyde dehydrogenase/glutarate-semialdehyde dehydrogenase